MKINRFPIRIVSRPERSPVPIELVAEDQIPCAPVTRNLCVELLVCVAIDESGEVCVIGYLAGPVSPAKVTSKRGNWC